MGIIGAFHGSEFSMAAGRFVVVGQNDENARVYVGRENIDRALDFKQLCDGGGTLYSAVDPKHPMHWKIQIGISIGSGDTEYMSAIIDTGASISTMSPESKVGEIFVNLDRDRFRSLIPNEEDQIEMLFGISDPLA